MRNLLGTCGLLLLSTCKPQAECPGRAILPAGTAAYFASQAVQILPASTCPVNFAVTRLSAQSLRNAGPGGPPSPPSGAALDLSVMPLHTDPVRRASITVFGLAGPTFLRVGRQPGSETSENLTVLFWSRQQGRSHSKAYPVRITGVQEVELHEMTFADGSVWHEPSEGACRVVPNGFHLVEDH